MKDLFNLFGIKTSQPLAVVEAMDELSEANCPGTSSVRLMNELFNGTDETTHTIVITYPDKESINFGLLVLQLVQQQESFYRQCHQFQNRHFSSWVCHLL